MLHTKLQGHRHFVFGEEDFLRFLPYMGMEAILVMWSGPFEQTFVPPSHGGSVGNLTLIGQAVSEEIFKECGRQTTDGQTDDGRRRPTYPISSPVSLRLRWAKMELIRIHLAWFGWSRTNLTLWSFRYWKIRAAWIYFARISNRNQ